jgi:hypothetical protein
MRTAFVASLIIAAGVVSAAQAQDQTPPAQPAAPATAPAAPAPDVSAAAPAPAAAEPAPTLPTTGDGAVVLSVIEKICVPLVRGGKLDDLAKANGFKQNRRDNTWVMGLGGDKNYTVTLFSPGSNKDVCRGEVHYAPGQDKPIVSAINIWSFLHKPELVLQANYVNTDPDGIKRVRKSWEHLESNSSVAVNFSTMTKPDDSPLNAKWGTAEFYYQERTF